MRKKLRLDLETLSVQSFAAQDGVNAARGTVRAAQQGGEQQCTKWRSCDCWTAYYRCEYFDFTEYSCDYDTTGPAVTVDC